MGDLAVIVRLHYKPGHPDWEWRFAYFRDHCLPRLDNQVGTQPYDIWVWCEPEHDAEVQALSSRIRTFHAPYTPRGERFLEDQTPYAKVEGLPKYDIQVGVDSDDLVSPWLLAKVRSVCRGTRSLLVSFQPVLYDVHTGKRYYMKQRYGNRKGSAIFALYSPPGKPFIFAYETGHIKMPQRVDRVLSVPEGYAMASVHGHNYSTGLGSARNPYHGPKI